MKINKKVFDCEIKEVNEQENTITAMVSTKAVDRMGDIVEPAGVDLKHFKKNPVVLWAHDYKSPPIAKAQWIKIDEKGKGLISKMKFAETDFAKDVFNLYKDGFMKAFSIGFMGKETEDIKDKEGRWTGIKFIKTELLEYSAVPVPANPEALSNAMGKGIISEKTNEILETCLLKDTSEEEPEKEEDKPEEDVTNGGDKPIEEEPKEEEKKETAFDEMVVLQEENNMLKETNDGLVKEIRDLRYKLCSLLYTPQDKTLSEMSGEEVAQKISEVVAGGIRKAQGKID